MAPGRRRGPAAGQNAPSPAYRGGGDRSTLRTTVLYMVVRALQSMKKGSQLSFQLQNFAVWFGMAMGGTAIGAASIGEIFARRSFSGSSASSGG